MTTTSKSDVSFVREISSPEECETFYAAAASESVERENGGSGIDEQVIVTVVYVVEIDHQSDGVVVNDHLRGVQIPLEVANSGELQNLL